MPHFYDEKKKAAKPRDLAVYKIIPLGARGMVTFVCKYINGMDTKLHTFPRFLVCGCS